MKLLIVDDDIPTAQAVLESVKKMPLDFGDIQVAHNVVAAKKIMEEGGVDVVLCDIEMPKYSGLDLIAWARENKCEAEFVFLTCHADFNYASKAIQYKADAYITKPLDFAVLQKALIQVSEKIAYNSEMKRRSEFGELWLGSRERIENALWREILFSDVTAEFKTATKTEEQQKANIDFDIKYQLVLCSFLETQVEEQGWEHPTFRYAACNMAGDIFFGGPNVTRVFDYSRNDRIYIAVIAKAEPQENQSRCKEFAMACKGHLQCPVVVYLSEEADILQLAALRSHWQKVDGNNVARANIVVTREEQLEGDIKPESLDAERIQQLLLQGNTVEPVNLVRKILNNAAQNGRLTTQILHNIHQDYAQIVFSLLYNENIMAHQLFSEPSAKQLEKVCENSTFDMLKWASYVSQKTAGFIMESREAETIIGKIKRYIEDNLNKDITREDVAKQVYLSADYVSKIFKAETGFFLKDYINEQKIEVAKQLLREGKKNISEIASAVGFDNFSYFSTLFKKSTGLSPSEYKKQKGR